MAAVKNSKIDLKTAKKMMVDFIQSYISSSSCPLPGNSIRCDKQFLQKCIVATTIEITTTIEIIISIVVENKFQT